MQETYISTDIETDGPIPGPNSMLSFGSVAYTPEGERLGAFSANLETLPGAAADPSTAAWWATQPAAWEACRRGLQEPAKAMTNYIDWVKSLPGKPVFVGFPVGFDFLFMYWYMIRFAGESPFSFSALDGKTLAMSLMKCDYRKAVKRNYPKRWKSSESHTHIALGDAIEQGELFIKMLKELKS